jgi:tetratricopeptide (TPR) repeat protein
MPLNKMSLAICAAAMASMAVPQTGFAQTRPDWASGLSAADTRAMTAQLSRTAGQRDAMAARYGLSRRTLAAIAGEVGVHNRQFTDAQLLAAVDSMADRARTLLAENARLRTDIAALADPAVRDPALAALTRAEAALAEGRLADAEAEFGRVKDIRWGESEQARTAWDGAVEAEAKTAELRQEFVRAQDLRLAASDRWLELEHSAHRQAFIRADAAAQGRIDEGRDLGRREPLDAAIALYDNRILPMVPREQHPELWAWAQNNLGVALRDQGERTSGAARSALLTRAIAAFDAALEVRTIEAMPAEWADTQNNLGTALQTQGLFTEGEEGLWLFVRATSAYSQSQIVFTPEFPAKWAKTQSNKGIVLYHWGNRTSGEDGLDMLVRAVAANEAALEVFPRAENPSDWAGIIGNLGATLDAQGRRTGGANGRSLLVRAVAAYETSLEVRTRADKPALWALMRQNMGYSEEAIADLSTPADATTHLRAAERALLDALTVYTPGEMGTYYEECTAVLLEIRAKLARLEGPGGGT